MKKDVNQIRFNKTLKFLNDEIHSPARILDLGPPNSLSDLMKQNGYNVTNTDPEIDLDLNYDIVKQDDFDAVTAFEIFEHMVAPFNVLLNIKAPKLIASVPLRLWFSRAYWNENDPFDCHFHEFEINQFNMLLKKAGWKIKRSEKWLGPVGKIGIRPLLRSITPRYYIVFCERDQIE